MRPKVGLACEAVGIDGTARLKKKDEGLSATEKFLIGGNRPSKVFFWS